MSEYHGLVVHTLIKYLYIILVIVTFIDLCGLKAFYRVTFSNAFLFPRNFRGQNISCSFDFNVSIGANYS